MNAGPSTSTVELRIRAHYATGGWSHQRLADTLNAEVVSTLKPKPSAPWHVTTVRIALATALP
jgi:hypothetical protein